MSWPTLELTNWSDFLEITEALNRGPAVHGNYVARGQSAAEWGLSPTLSRLRPANDSHESFIDLERLLVKEFVSKAHLHVTQDVLGGKHNQLQKWAVMQHHGAPTRLLDWSYSPFVAAYYAVNSQWDQAGAIWLFQEPILVTQMEKKFDVPDGRSFAEFLFKPDAPLAVLPWAPPTLTERMTAQQGLFTVALNPLTSHEETLAILRPLQEDGAEVLRKIIVPAGLKPSFLRHLKTMNITASALFPGVDGLGLSISELAQLSATPGEGSS